MAQKGLTRDLIIDRLWIFSRYHSDQGEPIITSQVKLHLEFCLDKHSGQVLD